MGFGYFGSAGGGAFLPSSPEIAVSGNMIPGGTFSLSATSGTLISANVSIGGVVIPAKTGFTYLLPSWVEDAAEVVITGSVKTDDGNTVSVSTPSAQTWVIPLATQSNMLGSDPEVGDDGVAWPAGVLMANLDGTTFAPGANVVGISNETGNAGSYLIAKHFAIDFLTSNPGDTIIFIPAAVSGASFVNGRWNPGDDLYTKLIDATNATLAANPGALIRCVLVQGFERDCVLNMPSSDFRSALDGFIDGIQTEMGKVTPIIFGELPSDFVGVDASRIAIRDIGLNTENRRRFTASASSRSPSVLATVDGTHYTRAALAEMGSRQYLAMAQAEANGAVDAAGVVGGVTADYFDADGVQWREHDFKSSGSLDVFLEGEAEVTWISGGGGGADGGAGGAGGAGGGAGGLYKSKVTLTVGTHTVLIGAGGAPGNDNSAPEMHGFNGSETSFMGVTPPGGGGGISWEEASSVLRSDGGSGGGGGSTGAGGPKGLPGGSGAAYLGHDGGDGFYTTTGMQNSGYGGGGGAGGPGENAAAGVSGSGGPGLDILTSSGLIGVCGGGAGGQGDVSVSVGSATHGGGAPDQNGAQNTGGGGGGALFNSALNAGAGGSGRLLIRYRIS